eukprot:12416834-Prorocentrum_lima.AAC.1
MRARTRPDKWCCDGPHDPLQPLPHLHIHACAQDAAPTCPVHVRFFQLHAAQHAHVCIAAPQ